MAASGFPQQYGHQFQGNSSPTAGAPWDFAAFPAPQHPQSVSRSHSRPPPGQARDHAGVLQDSLQDAMVSTNWHRGIPPFTRAHAPAFFNF